MVRVLSPQDGLDQFSDVIWAYGQGPADSTGAAVSTGANTAFLTRFRVARPFLVSAIQPFCNAVGAGGNVITGIFTSADQSTFVPVATSGVVAAASLTWANCTMSYRLVPGTDYWTAMACDSIAPTWARGSLSPSTHGLQQALLIQKASAYSGSGFVANLSSMAASTFLPTLKILGTTS